MESNVRQLWRRRNQEKQLTDDRQPHPPTVIQPDIGELNSNSIHREDEAQNQLAGVSSLRSVSSTNHLSQWKYASQNNEELKLRSLTGISLKERYRRVEGTALGCVVKVQLSERVTVETHRVAAVIWRGRVCCDSCVSGDALIDIISIHERRRKKKQRSKHLFTYERDGNAVSQQKATTTTIDIGGVVGVVVDINPHGKHPLKLCSRLFLLRSSCMTTTI